jgi:hypothetical protein
LLAESKQALAGNADLSMLKVAGVLRGDYKAAPVMFVMTKLS